MGFRKEVGNLLTFRAFRVFRGQSSAGFGVNAARGRLPSKYASANFVVITGRETVLSGGMSHAEPLEKLRSLRNHGSKFGVERMRRLAGEAGTGHTV